MSEFKQFKLAVNRQFESMTNGKLFTTDVTKDEVWDMYLNSFEPGTNPMFKERTEHDCQCCKQFIRAAANVVAIKDNELVSIWDVEVPKPYQVVADALSKLVKSKQISNRFYHYESNLGTDRNVQLIGEDSIVWQHFHYKLPSSFVKSKLSIPSTLAKYLSNKNVFKRGLDEITFEAIDTVIDLINQNSLYKGQEFLATIKNFKIHKEEYDNATNKDYYCWYVDPNIIRNSSIGTLLVNLSEGMGLDEAVGKFEAIVAPTNYKRPKALITKSMIKRAEKQVKELGFEDSLERRHSTIEDITINNILFANRESKKEMNVFDELSKSVVEKPSKFGKIEKVQIDDFIENVLPDSEKIELYFENKYKNNLVSLLSPKHKDSKCMLKWDNNFSWSYNGNVTDSIKENVRKHGGETSGVLRFSIQWNESGQDKSDLDAHCLEPNSKNLIYYQKKNKIQPSSGMLDVDIVYPKGKIAVENIIYTDKSKMPNGVYTFLIHMYNKDGSGNFSAEIEFDGKIHYFSYNDTFPNHHKIIVAKVTLSNKGFEIIKTLDSSVQNKELWSINTNSFHNVRVVMNSPNYWDGRNTGNKHWFFMLDECINPDRVRGFYNEFLTNELHDHRKVFEVLGDKMKAEKSDKQLSGLGFSSTKRDSVLVRVTSSFSRLIEVIF